MTTPVSRLITPPKQEEEIYPYRRVWQSLTRESVGLIGLVILIYVAFDLVGLPQIAPIRQIVNVILAIIPALLWYAFSFIAEQQVPQPRPRMGEIFLLTFLTATAIGVPSVENILQPSTWLATETTFNRIIGYTVTIGIIQEFIKYIVLRYTVWQSFSTRQDSIAYATTVAIAYATVTNLSYAFHPDMLIGAVATRVLANTTISVIGSLVVSYGLAQTWLTKTSFLLLPGTVLVSALLTGLAITVRSGVVNAQLSISAISPRPLFGLGFSIAFYGVMIGIMLFIYNSTEKQERESLKLQEE